VPIRYGSIWLAGRGVFGARDFVVDGERLVDEVHFWRAARTTFYARGNRSATVSFSVTRLHASDRAAAVARATHLDSLQDQADLELWCGVGDDVQLVVLRDAVFVQGDVRLKGNTTEHTYTFRGAVIETDSVPGPDPFPADPDPEEGSDVTRRNTVALDSGAYAQDVAFITPMSGAPHVTVTIQVPAGGDDLDARIEAGSVTAAGFRLLFPVQVPGIGYYVTYHAIL
jgi:hypothetical protein